MLNFNAIVKDFSLQRVSEEELWQLRLGKKPFLIVKLNDYLFVSLHRKDFSAIIKKCKSYHIHLCDKCRKFSALSKEEGGCDKTHDISLIFPYFNNLKHLEKDGKKNFTEDCLTEISSSFRIEKYNFVCFGIEVIQKGLSRCIILKCQDYEKEISTPKKKSAYVPKTVDKLPNSFEEEILKKIMEKISS